MTTEEKIKEVIDMEIRSELGKRYPAESYDWCESEEQKKKECKRDSQNFVDGVLCGYSLAYKVQEINGEKDVNESRPSRYSYIVPYPKEWL